MQLQCIVPIKHFLPKRAFPVVLWVYIIRNTNKNLIFAVILNDEPIHGLLELRTGNFNITVKKQKIDALIFERIDEID